ncbi:MAG: hypothetical protein JSW11_20525 [Candidatus Heimdallarchaeota archaeon]|nr:MAG: hypothetical protein JSW11_20525 [Candidatus Heimdallarchaeota archaeon]
MKSTTKRIDELEQLIKSLMLEIHNNINYSVKNISHLEKDVDYLKSLMKIDTLDEKNALTDKLVDVLREFSYQYSKCQICGIDKILIQCSECKRHTCMSCLNVVTSSLGRKQCLYCGHRD